MKKPLRNWQNKNNLTIFPTIEIYLALGYNKASVRALSSVGRALARQARGRWFEPSSAHHKTILLDCLFFALKSIARGK